MGKIKINYSVLREGDIYLTHSRKPTGRIIRLAETEKFDIKDKSTPTHGGIIVEWQSQLFGAEMKPRLRLSSLEEYTKDNDYIVEVWRPAVFDNVEIWKNCQEEIALEIRRNAEDTHYDLPGAILSSPLGNKLFGWIPWFKNKTSNNFCTEFLCKKLKKYGDNNITDALSPLAMSRYFQFRGEKEYRKINNWRIT